MICLLYIWISRNPELWNKKPLAAVGSGDHIPHHRGQVLGEKSSSEVFSGAATNQCPHLPPGEVPEGAVDVIWVKRLKDIGHWGSQCGSWSRRCFWSWSARRRSLGQRVGSRGHCRWGQARQRRTHIHEGTTLEVLLAGVFWTWSFNDETFWS